MITNANAAATADAPPVLGELVALPTRKVTMEIKEAESQTETDAHQKTDGVTEEVAEAIEKLVTDNSADAQAPDTDVQPPSAPTPSPASVADPLYIEMKAESAKLAQKAQAVVNGRFRQAGRCAGYIQAFGGDETLIRADLEERGVKWPDANCLNPVETVMAREYIFEGEDCTAIKNRVSEFARVIKHLVHQKVLTPEGALKYIKKNQGLRGLYSKLDADGNVRIEGVKEDKEEITGSDTTQTGAQQTATVEQAAVQPNGWDTTQTGTVACAVTKVEQVVADTTTVVADAIDALDFSDVAERAEAEFQRAEADAMEAERNLSAARSDAEAAAEQAEAELADRIAEAERVAKEKAAVVEKAQRLRDLAVKLRSVPVWGEGKIDGPRPPSKAGGEWAYGGISLAVIRTDDDGTFYVVGNVTPAWDEFNAIIDTQFPAT